VRLKLIEGSGKHWTETSDTRVSFDENALIFMDGDPYGVAGCDRDSVLLLAGSPSLAAERGDGMSCLLHSIPKQRSDPVRHDD
jgi:hypothetical protein